MAAVAALLLACLLDLALDSGLGWLFDVAFVAVCVAAALLVRPRDFFGVGVLPPLLMLGAMVLLALVDRDIVGQPDDGVLQASVSGLAHHVTGLVTGYLLALALLALRQVAHRNAGRLRAARS